jgi:hypothetical protein
VLENLSCHQLIKIQALNSACLRKESFQQLLDNILGVIFLGTPHSAADDPGTLDRCMDIALSLGNKKGSFKPFSPVEARANDAYQISSLCTEFEINRLPISVLSVYDGEETKVGRRMLRAKSVKVRYLSI